MEGGVDNLFKQFRHNHLQVLEGFLFLLFDLPLVLFAFLFFFCNYGGRYFVILADLLWVPPLFAQEEGKGLFR